MSRTKPTTSFLQQKPRKLLKIDTLNQKCYNQFQGNSQIDEENQIVIEANHHNDKEYNNDLKDIPDKNITIEEEMHENQQIYKMITTQQVRYKRVNAEGTLRKQKNQHQDKSAKNIKKENFKRENIKKQQSNVVLPKVKLQEGTEQAVQVNKQAKSDPNDKSKSKTEQNPSKKQPKIVQVPSSNWQKFLDQSKQIQSTQHPNQKPSVTPQGISTAKQSSRFVAMDCQFVKCDEDEHLARISIVSEQGLTLYDSYIKPERKITDFITPITGITFSHLKNAPKWAEQVSKVKKILMGKILVGHTLHKDLEVTKLTDWKGVSQKIDISEFSQYKDKGGSKVVGLKRLTTSLLNRNIQAGWHSSVQDAVATMDLFKINKKKILKQLKLIS